jgi:LPXTG-motif cell wall-anchored protein
LPWLYKKVLRSELTPEIIPDNMKKIVLLLMSTGFLASSCSDIETGTKITITAIAFAVIGLGGYLLLRRKK